MKFPQTRLRSLHSAKQTYLEIKITENKETNKQTYIQIEQKQKQTDQQKEIEA
jgi:hypothetical protein